MALTALQVKNAKPGRHADGRGLYLFVKPSGARSWVLRVQSDGKRRDFGLGPTDLVSLGAARDKALEGRKLVRDGLDPKIEWKRNRTSTPTFQAVAKEYIARVKDGWSNAKHGDQWLSSLERHIFPALGDKAIDAIDAANIQEALLPIWLKVPETARRLKQRIGAVLDYGHTKGWRAAEAPMRAVGKGLPKQQKSKGHFEAMPYADLPAFMSKFRQADGTAGRLALEFVILTAARSGEARGATWSEINRAEKTWTIPAERMKAREEHIVPLSETALAVLDRAADFADGPDSIIFPGVRGKALSDMTLAKALRVTADVPCTVHGMRSAFRDWAAEQTSAPGDVVEAALAHTVRNKVEAAYKRTKYLDKRRPLMDAWAAFIG